MMSVSRLLVLARSQRGSFAVRRFSNEPTNIPPEYRKGFAPPMGDDGKPSKEFIDFFTKLASEIKRTDITARQQLLNNPKTQDFRALVAKRKNLHSQGLRYTSDELKILFTDVKEGKIPKEDTERMKRLFQKYELVE